MATTKKEDSGGRLNRHLHIQHYDGEKNGGSSGTGTADGNGIFDAANNNGEWLARNVNVSSNTTLHLGSFTNFEIKTKNFSAATGKKMLTEKVSDRVLQRSVDTDANQSSIIDQYARNIVIGHGTGNAPFTYYSQIRLDDNRASMLYSSQNGNGTTGVELMDGYINFRVDPAAEMKINNVSNDGTKVFTTDNNGTAKWGYADVLSIGATAPVNTKLIWIDNTGGTGVAKYFDGSTWVNLV